MIFLLLFCLFLHSLRKKKGTIDSDFKSMQSVLKQKRKENTKNDKLHSQA